MKVDGGLITQDLAAVPARARALEAAGYDGAVTAEIASDPFLPLALAAEHTERLELMTSIAVAFARNPMLLANVGHDLNAYSKGRFILGLGSQIRPHIQKRFSMPWSHPAARMRELILAMRAVWDCWYRGKPLDFRGEFYQHTLMTPMFTPTHTEYGAPRVFLAAVGPMMTEVAGEVADGLIAHAFTTDRYVRDVTLPAIARGLERSGRRREDFQITCPVFVVTGRDDARADIELSFPTFVVTGETDEEWQKADAAVREQIAFYGSTPAYRGVLESYGWGDLQPELNRLSKAGQWDEMGRLIGDDVLDAFAIVGAPGEIAGKLEARYGGLFDRILGGVMAGDPEETEQLRALQAVGGSR
jgi:alkanesulfonate monooxygenase SsuD/methylene tetrahydromethanopterin reductase-like flavin-dependent oxidoreductase (luciferase family)